jgi:hypothetical protein
MTQKTSYQSHFGEPPKAAEDYVVIKQKKLRDLEISKFLQTEAVNSIERWVENNLHDEFTEKLYFTLREIHTIVKNQAATIPTSSDSFIFKRGEKAPRYDKILLSVKYNPSTRSKSSFKPVHSL